MEVEPKKSRGFHGERKYLYKMSSGPSLSKSLGHVSSKTSTVRSRAVFHRTVDPTPKPPTLEISRPFVTPLIPSDMSRRLLKVFSSALQRSIPPLLLTCLAAPAGYCAADHRTRTATPPLGSSTLLPKSPSKTASISLQSPLIPNPIAVFPVAPNGCCATWVAASPASVNIIDRFFS